jgi:hypothetical protein
LDDSNDHLRFLLDKEEKRREEKRREEGNYNDQIICKVQGYLAS